MNAKPSETQNLEIEMKFRLSDATAYREALAALGAVPLKTVEQADLYFAHPVRDFVQTDEALRVRTIGDSGCVTYKGPLLDSETKSREETEIGFLDGVRDAVRFGHMLKRLGFASVREVRKQRQAWKLEWQGRSFEATLDRVEGLGEFAELETVGTQLEFEAAKTALRSLAEKLQLGPGERRSYLGLLLDRESHASSPA